MVHFVLARLTSRTSELGSESGIEPMRNKLISGLAGAVFSFAAALCAGVGLFAFCPNASADEGFGGFGHLATPVEQQPWGPVPTEKTSIANLAPILLPFFNNGPVFGLPGTVTGSFWDRTQLTGDWGGARTDLARHGFFFDLYSISAYQDVFSGGLKTGSAFVQNTQLSINVDTGRADLWSGGLIHFTAQSRIAIFLRTPQQSPRDPCARQAFPMVKSSN